MLQWYATQIDFAAAAPRIASLRPIPEEPLFSITASFVGRRNYSADEIKQTVAEGVRSVTGWRYSPDDRQADLNLRIFIEHEIAYVGVRLSQHPLHERAYKQVERPASLKPSVAAAMLRLCDLQPGQRLIDPCCGSGTILIEAALVPTSGLPSARVWGGDLDPEAVEAAAINAQAAAVRANIAQWDARALPIGGSSADRVVTNLPWGRQVELDAGLYRAVCRETERVLAGGGRAVMLTSTPELLSFEALQPTIRLEISLFGQTPTICVFE